MTSPTATTPDPRFSDLERALAAAGPAPRLIWYGSAGDRIELSGAVLLNWAAKTANLLVEECDVEPGAAVRLALPVHWRTLAIALGAWQAGADLRTGADAGPVAVHVDVAPSADGELRADQDVVVALGALDLAWPGQLPPDVLDYAALVRSFGDGFGGDPASGPLGLYRDGRSVALGESAADEPGTGGSVMEPGRARALDPALDLAATLEAAVDAWLDGVAVLITDDAERLTDAVLASERAVRAS
ncbi:TIGR03089 family protein [Tersicoccus sp. MR15.9]|uniref:TIGR03089 family protein n=1 Tax=Tersicoccus mangrovi TaxID=3121635 RepID=UPI002FE51B7B